MPNDGIEKGGPPTQRAYEPFPSFQDWDTGYFDSAVVDRYEKLLLETRKSAGDGALARAVETATRYAAVDTGALEGLYQVDRGFTRTVATQAAAWESLVASRGEHVRRSIDDALAAYDFVMDAVTHLAPINHFWIKRLHETICRSQETYTVYTQTGPEERELVKGQYKALPNSPTSASTGHTHHYAPVLDTQPEMDRLFRELDSSAFAAAHPVLQASYAHYAYVAVHPFADGNGRVARALASVFLYRKPGVPLVIFADQRNDYLDALEAADQGDTRPFVNFIERCTVDAVGIVRAHIHSSGPPIAQSLAALEAFYAHRAGSPDFDAATARITDFVKKELDRQIRNLALPAGVDVRVMTTGAAGRVPPGFRSLLPEKSIRLVMRAAYPAQLQQHVIIATYPRGGPEALSDFVVTSDSNGDVAEIALREVEPDLSATLRLKIEGWVEGQLSAAFAKLVEAVAKRDPGGTSVS